MILTTSSKVPGKNLKSTEGLVHGSTVRTTSAKEDVMTGLKGVFGGELTKATKIIEIARHEATNRMIAEAKEKGADAIIGVQYSAASNIFGAIELFVYGTAVKLD